MTFVVELARQTEGRRMAGVPDLPGGTARGGSSADATSKDQALASPVAAERLQHGEAGPDLLTIAFKAA